MAEKTYEDGVIEGRLDHHATILDTHGERLNGHSGQFSRMDVRIGRFEKIIYTVGGMLIVIQVLVTFPQLLEILVGRSG